MNNRAIARRYAGALFKIAKEEKDLERFARALEQVSGTLTQDRDFRRLIYHRLLPNREKQKIMDTFFPEFSPLLKNFFNLVLHKRRERILPEISIQFRHLVDRENKIIPVELRSAVPLSPEVEAVIKKRLAEAIGKNVRLHSQTEPAILGGLVIRMGGRILDASLKKKLELMARHLKRA